MHKAARKSSAGKAAPALSAAADNLAGFRAIAEQLEGDRRMDQVAGQLPAGLMVGRIDPRAPEDGEARKPGTPVL